MYVCDCRHKYATFELFVDTTSLISWYYSKKKKIHMLIIHVLEYLKFIVSVMITTELHVIKSAIFC